MKLVKYKLTDITTPKQWKSLSMSEMTTDGYPVFSANGFIGRYKEFNHEKPTITIGCRGTCGAIHLTQPFAYITSNAMALDNLDEGTVDIQYLYYALKNYDFRKIITGTSQPQITREGLQKVVLDIPESKEDQIYIASVLRKTENLVAQRKESVHLLDEYLKSTFLEMFGNLALNRKNWVKSKFRELIFEGEKINYGIVQPGEDGRREGIAVIRVGDFDGIKINSKNLKLVDPVIEQKHRASRLVGDELLIVCVGATIGKVALVDKSNKGNNIVRAIARIRCDSKKINRRYLCQLLQTEFYQFNLRNSARTVAQPTLNIAQIEELKIILPPIDLQNKFADIAQKTDELKTQYQQSLQELEYLYGSLSQKAFKGELTLK